MNHDLSALYASVERPLAARLRCILAGVAAAMLVACGSPPYPPLPAGAVVVVLGDSITAGYGVEQEQAWPAQLARLTGWNVINGGVSGDRSADALQRLPTLLTEHTPALVMIEIGGNDMLQHESDASIESNVTAMLSAVKARGAQAVVLAIPRPSVAGEIFRSLTPAKFYGEIAAHNSVPVAAKAISGVLSKTELRIDPLHPNAAGHVELARQVAAELRDFGLAR